MTQAAYQWPDFTTPHSAICRRFTGLFCHRPAQQELLHHSDQGSQYTSDQFQKLMDASGVVCSMSWSGNCWDNAVSESFFASLKKELVYQQRYATRDEARQSIFQWIETFYNRTRLHSHLGYMSPEQFEQQS